VIRTNPPTDRESETLSSDTLFTFTSNPLYLLDMLINGIKPRYFYEVLPFVENNWFYIIAAKCFCDIPLSKIKAHLNWYGNYGLGIKKSFLQGHGVSPVAYIHHKSFWILNLIQGNDRLDSNTIPIIPYLKRYFGDDFRLNEDGSPKHKLKKFYDEREWRYVPKQKVELLADEENTLDYYLNLVKRKNKNHPFVDAKIALNPDDVEYIIIHTFFEYSEFRKKLRDNYSDDNEYESMLSKILFSERILRDF